MLSPTSRTKPGHKWEFEAIGTRWLVETDAPVYDDLKKEIAERIEIFDRTYSRFRDDSLVRQIAQAAGEYAFPNDVKKLVSLYEKLYETTNGAVSPLVGSMLEQAGYSKEYSLQPGDIRDVPTWSEVMEWHDTRVKTRQPVVLDFGAAGKGYLVDIVAELLQRYGHTRYVIDGSGDMLIRGGEEIIGLENPYDAESVIGTTIVKNASLCASATNRRAWGDWHHVVDPHAKKPVNDVVATWVVADSTLVADGLATALFFVDADKLADWDFEYVRLDNRGRIEHSPGFVGELFT